MRGSSGFEPGSLATSHPYCLCIDFIFDLVSFVLNPPKKTVTKSSDFMPLSKNFSKVFRDPHVLIYSP